MINDNTAQWRIKKVGAFPTPNMQGATASADGKAGTVPSPKIADRSKVLRGDGTWGNAPVAEALSSTLPINKGGTGATTVENARTNLGISAGQLVSAGFIAPYAGTTVPDGWLACNGATVSRTTYASLFSAVGTTYGSGDGSTTFNLPNMGSNIISEVSTGDLAVKGNGMALGISDGSHNAIFTTVNTGAIYQNNGYGSNLGSNVTSGAPLTSNKVLGITTDGSKSGMVVPVTATKTTVKYCIKY